MCSGRKSSRLCSMAVALGGILAAATIGCGEKTPCDDAFLTTLVAQPEPSADKERIRVSVGIRDACPNMADWTRARMLKAYEGLGEYADERGAWLENEETEQDRQWSAPLRNRVCPAFDEIVGEAAGATRTAQQWRARLWDGCDLRRFGLYDGPASVGERGPSGLFDFSVFTFLKDGGVRPDTAATAVRALGKTRAR